MSKRSSPKARERMYIREAPNGPFTPLENISVTVQPPRQPETVHTIQRRVIMGGDSTRAVMNLSAEFEIYRNAEMSATLVCVNEPTPGVWQKLKAHMEAEDNQAEMLRAARATRHSARGRAPAIARERTL